MDTYLDRLATVVERQPDLPAVSDAEKEITFRELENASDRLARLMYAQRKTANDVFAYLGNPGVERIVSLIAALKAGAALLGLDSLAPAAVVRDLLETCDVTAILAEPGFEAQARGLHPAEPFILPPDLLDPAPVEPFRRQGCDPDALASILYTSGSTGRPKCVPLLRGALDRRLTRKFEVLYPPRPGWQRTNLVTHFRLFPELYTLQNGETADCFDLRKHGVAAMADWLREKRITSYSSQVSVLRQLMATTDEPFPDITLVTVVGEQVGRSDVEAFEAHFPPGAELAVRFGSTEHCDVAVYRHRHGDPMPGDTLPIGYPAFPHQIRLLNDAGLDVEPGQPGEIVITGDFMASYYIKDPARSAEFFAVDPSDNGLRRCYTGFVAYADGKGMLHPVGRKDEQIKIRGYNVRPPEVEQIVQRHPGVERAAVVPFEGPNRIRRLACFYSPAGETAPTARDLRDFLADQVPNYFIPSLFHPIDEFPLSASGKLAKKDLPDPLTVASEQTGQAERESTDTERAVAKIWSGILGYSGFGLEEDFFDIGGDSLQAMAVIVAIEAKFGVRLPLESLILDGASIRALAGKVEAATGNRAAFGAVVSLRKGGEFPPLFVTHVAGGHLSDYLAFAHIVHSEQPVLGLHPRGLDGVAAPASTMDDLAADAIIAMRRHAPAGPYRLMGYSFGGIVAFEMARQLVDAGEEVSHLVLLDPFATWTDPARLLRSIYRPLKAGDAKAAMARAARVVPAAIGVREASANLDEAHRTASLRYRPQPLALPRALLVSASENPTKDVIQREWRRLLGEGLTIAEQPADHPNLVREPAVWSVARTVEGFLRP